jgi:hypothetical protein
VYGDVLRNFIGLFFSIILLSACSNHSAKLESIGSATMRNDGVIILLLRAESETGQVGQSQVLYNPGTVEYDNLIKHLNGLVVGQNKAVPPWK